jgi:hypothetical protein
MSELHFRNIQGIDDAVALIRIHDGSMRRRLGGFMNRPDFGR